MKYKYVTSIICSSCKDQVWSRYRHDMRYCKCGKSFIDGGRDYIHVGWEPDIHAPRTARMRVSVDEYVTHQPRWPY